MSAPRGRNAAHLVLRLDTDGPALSHALEAAESGVPAAALAGAIALTRLRRLDAAARTAEKSAKKTKSIPLKLVAARILFVARRHQKALAVLQATSADAPDSARASQTPLHLHPASAKLASSLAQRLHWYNDAYQAQLENLEGPDPARRAAAASHALAIALAAGRPHLALRHAEHACAAGDPTPEGALRVAELALTCFRDLERLPAQDSNANSSELLKARARAERALHALDELSRRGRAPCSPAQHAALYTALGDFERAAHILKVAPESALTRCQLGHFALWRGDAELAAEHLASTQATSETSEFSSEEALALLRLHLAVGLAQGTSDDALSAVDTMVDGGLELALAGPDFWCTYSDALRAADQPEAADAALAETTLAHAPSALRIARARVERGLSLGELADEVLPLIHALERAHGLTPTPRAALIQDVGAARDALERAIALLGFNFSNTPSTLVEGELRLLRVQDGWTPSVLAELQARVLLGTPAETIAKLEKLRDRAPWSAPARVALADVHLWVGDYHAADRELQAALDTAELPPRAHAHALLMRSFVCQLLGDAAGALQRLNAAESAVNAGLKDEGVRGGLGAERDALRGELRLRRGDLDGAWTVLSRASNAVPGRVSTVLLLALCAARLEVRDLSKELDINCDEEAEQYEQQDVHRAWLLHHAPGLLSDAAAALDLPWLGQRDEFPKPAVMEQVLEKALEMMRGCRHDAFCTYWTEGGVLRAVVPEDVLHQADSALLTAALTLLHRVARLPAPSPVAYALPQRRASLSAKRQAFAIRQARLPTNSIQNEDRPSVEDLERFRSQGYLKIERCVEPEVAREWRERALAGMLEDPAGSIAKFVSMDGSKYSAANPSAFLGDPYDFTGFDPDDPSTWRRARIDINLARHAFYGKVSSKLWAAIDTFTGDANRLSPGSQKFSEYFILNLAMGTNNPELAPADTVTAWHLDAPRTDATLHNIHANLLLLMLFTDVEIDRGPTYIAPESVWKVAEPLARSPEGVDFTDKGPGLAIAAECTERVPLTGKAGDVYVLHPFMLHTPSCNRTGRIRWVSNPVLFSQTPLDFSGTGKSPVEQMIHAHLST